MTTSFVLLVFVLGLALGAAIGAWVATARTAAALGAAQGERALLRERITDLEAAAGQDAELVATLAPLAATITRVEQQVGALERDRLQQFTRLDEHLQAVRTSGDELRRQTSALTGVLRASSARGSWGELQLRRVVEHAGMLERVDFTVQARGQGADGELRPDLVVHLPGGKQVVVDAKAPMAAFLLAAEHDPGPEQAQQAAAAHAKALRSHIDALAAKEYWAAFTPTPELVVCFVPGESFLATACSADPGLLEHALSRRVVPATPTTLVALLRTIAMSWQSEALTGSARELFEVGRELHARLSTLVQHTGKLGRDVQRCVDSYNAVVATLEGRVLVSARRMNALGVADEPLGTAATITHLPRPVTAVEWAAGER